MLSSLFRLTPRPKFFLPVFSFLFVMSTAVSSSAPKLYFRHGAVCSAKTLNLLAVAHSYKMQGKSVVVLKVFPCVIRHVLGIFYGILLYLCK